MPSPLSSEPVVDKLYGTPDEYGYVMRDLLENAPVGLAFVDANYRYVVANESIAAPEKMPLAAHIGLKVQDVVPDLWPKLEPIFDRVLAGEPVLSVDLRGDARGSRKRRWLTSFHPVKKDGLVIGIEVMGDDITDLRQTESDLRSSNHLYAMLAQAIHEISNSDSGAELFQQVVQISVNEGRFKFASVTVVRNGAIRVLTTAGEADGFFHEQQERGTMASLDPASAWSRGPTGQAFMNRETTVFNEISSELAYPEWREAVARLNIGSGAAFPIREGGAVVAVLTLFAEEPHCFEDGMLATLNDITPLISHAMDRFALERQGRSDESGLLLRDRALQAATQGAVIVDAIAEGQPIIYATPAFELLTGYRSEEIAGQNCRVLQGPGTDPDAIESIRAALAAGEGCSVELLNYRKNGEPFWNDLTISPILSDEGVITHFVGVQTDVTERHSLERQVRQVQKMEAVGQLAGGVAHDFNNILTVIRGEASLAMGDDISLVTQQHIKQVDIAAQHATELTHQLLAFSRQQVLKPEPTDINKVVGQTASLVARLIGDNIELHESLGPELDAVLVDPGQLQQVIINLAINARDAMAGGGAINFRTTAVDGYVMLEVSDDGCGMDEAMQAIAFDPFFTTKDEGTGLGLATVYGIVKQSGGHISIRSELDVGTTFAVYLPTTSEPVAAEEMPPSKFKSLEGTETILHVEDSPMIRPMISRMLGRHGYEILSAANANEAEAIVADHGGHIDMLLTDIVMPGLNGRELAENLHEDNPDLTVLFTSGYPSDTVVRQGVAESEVNFIQKPFIAADLLPLVRSLLDEGKKAA